MNIQQYRDRIIDRIRGAEHISVEQIIGSNSIKGLYGVNHHCFNMSKTEFDCNTPACVAGHLKYMAKINGDIDEIVEEFEQSTRKNFQDLYRTVIMCTLDLNYYEANYLFTGAYSNEYMGDITTEETVQYLEKLFEEYPVTS